MKTISKLVFLSMVMASCGSDPKVIPVENEETSGQTSGVFSDDGLPPLAGTEQSGAGNSAQGVHTVVVKEVLPTSKYVYLLVEEGGSEFWISTLKIEVKVGETYFYRDGLLKTNFHSTEHNRTFEKLYLVSQIVKVDHGNTAGAGNEMGTSETNIAVTPKNVVVPGSVRISELVANPTKYNGKEIQISGVITKVNVGIMNRNWLHLKDGSKDEYDLVVTSDQGVPEGHTVTLKGKVALNKDFGAGYKYAIIVEDALLVK
jgi:GW (Gly-Tryp) dipeptide domain